MPAQARQAPHAHLHPHRTPKPAAPPPEAPLPQVDLSHALPESALKGLPSSREQLGVLNGQLAKDRPAVADAEAKATALAAEAASLRGRLIATAAHIQDLEREQITLAGQIVSLEAENVRLTAGFARDRLSVTRLLAMLERVQHDMPPALVLRPGDALAAARGAMEVGASLPPLYARAADLARRITALKTTRAALVSRRAEAAATAAQLTKAHAELAVLSTEKDREAAGAAGLYAGLKQRLDRIAREAASFEALVARVAALRRGASESGGVVIVTAAEADTLGPLARGSLRVPVVGTVLPAPEDKAHNPGIAYAARPGAQVIAPADGKVLFAGPYHRAGQVLILEITTGYDLVLAGLGRVTVRPGDELLAGEPVGTMPEANSGDNSGTRLYFELRHDGRGLNPGPWLAPDVRKAKKT